MPHQTICDFHRIYSPLMIESKIKIRTRHVPKGMKILYDDRDIIIIDKNPKLLSVATDDEKELTVHNLLTRYIRKGNSKSKLKLFVVHRLDYNTSGIMIFAKTMEIREKFADQWTNVEKKYLALVHGCMKDDSGIIESYLADNDDFVVRSVANQEDGKLARTKFKVLKRFPNHTLLEIDLLTGKKNQIRVHFSENGHPIVGDIRYGAPTKGRLALHASSIKFKHPFHGEEMKFETEDPHFEKLIRSGRTPRATGNTKRH